MTLREVVENLELDVCGGGIRSNRIVTGVYAGDLLSDVIAHSKAGNIWITMQTHVNIVAVAVQNNLAAIILVNGRTPSEDAVRASSKHGIPIFQSSDSSYELAGELFVLGVGEESMPVPAL